MLAADAVPQADHVQQEGTDFRCANNTCRPMTAKVLQLFRQLQDQINRASAAAAPGAGFALLEVDGDIGPKTAQLVKTLAASMRQFVPTSVVPFVGDGEMRQALDLNLPNIVAKFADPLIVYFNAAEMKSREMDPFAGRRVDEYVKARTAIAPTSTQTAPTASSGAPKRGSRLPWVIAGIGAALTIGITATAITVSRTRSRKRRRAA